MRVTFQFEPEKAVAAIVYLASRHLPHLTKAKICKLIFLADKNHLVRYARPVTGDRMCAMDHGPVPSEILDMLNSVIEEGANSPQRMLFENVVIDHKFEQPQFSARDFRLGDFLSDSDIEALDAVIEAHGRKAFSELRAMTHELPAYKTAWDHRTNGSPRMEFEDFFEEDDDAIQGAYEAMIEDFRLREAVAGPAL